TAASSPPPPKNTSPSLRRRSAGQSSTPKTGGGPPASGFARPPRTKILAPKKRLRRLLRPDARRGHARRAGNRRPPRVDLVRRPHRKAVPRSDRQNRPGTADSAHLQSGPGEFHAHKIPLGASEST